ncbi:MAG: enoyl-CoA hydratase/isomerase family protein [Hyphomicrobiaceae bacterium]
MAAPKPPEPVKETMMEAVKLERKGGVAILRLDDPAVLNALSPAIKQGMAEKVPVVLGDESVRAIVLTGTGKAFCAGGDIRAMQDKEGRKAPAVRKRMQAVHTWARALLDADKPIIAAVNGPAVGGGLAIALLADIVVASSNAYFLSAYSKLGVLPDVGVLQTLPWAIGSLRAKEMILLNRKYTAEEAVQIGLANRCVAPERLMDEALAMAEEIASGPTAMLSMSKVMMKRAYESSVDEFFEREAIAQGVAFGSDEFAEGVEAFLAKRKPKFV